MRKLAREAVIFMLLGLVLSAVGGFAFDYNDQRKDIQTQRATLKKSCDSIYVPGLQVDSQSWVPMGISNANGSGYVSAAECTLVFGASTYPARHYDAGTTLSSQSAQDDAEALAEGKRILGLKVNYGQSAEIAAFISTWGFLGGLCAWLFYRLVRFAITG